MDLTFLIPIFGILLVMIPVAGLTMILTMRFALKPFVETLAKVLRDPAAETPPDLRLQIQDLNEQIQDLSQEVRSLREARDFDRKLLG